MRDLCRFIVTSISMGAQHTAVLIEGGQVITFGRNSEAQLGSGDCKPQQGLVNVKSLLQVNSMVNHQLFVLDINLASLDIVVFYVKVVCIVYLNFQVIFLSIKQLHSFHDLSAFICTYVTWTWHHAGNSAHLLQQVGCTPLSTVVSISNGQLLLLGSRYKQAPSTDSRNWLDPSSVKRQLSNEAVRSRQGSASSQRSLSQSSISSALKESQGLDHLGSFTLYLMSEHHN